MASVTGPLDAEKNMIDMAILKMNWERLTTHVDIEMKQLKRMIKPWSTNRIKSVSLLSEGCANTNYKIDFEDNMPAIVVRIYVRENSVLRREEELTKLLTNKLPIPILYYTDDSCELIKYPYAIFSFAEGTLMREILISNNEKAISECAYDAGLVLSNLIKIKYNEGGFFTENLSVRPFNHEEKYVPFLASLLESENVQGSLESQSLLSIRKLLTEFSSFIPDVNDANLTHGDFDPANILVNNVSGEWKVSAVLDWEFAFAGNYLLDVGMFLRYAHKLPGCYKKSFEKGLSDSEIVMPEHWRVSSSLMNLICLLQLLHDNPASQRPKMNKDLVLLVHHTIQYLNDYR